MTTFPYGYSGSPQGMGEMLTWDEMMTRSTVYNLHPELLRRFRALIEAAAAEGVPLGVGTGWRVQPSPPPPGFADPGNSWHESCPCAPVSATALAIDTVPDVSWGWMEANCAAYGLRTFRDVNDEPWHLQPVEIPAGRSWAEVLPPLDTWPLPGDEDDVKAQIIRGDCSDTYWAWDGVNVAGIPSLDWVQWGYDAGLYANVDPVVYPQGFVDELVATQGER
jgi:hypothetical protein